MEAYSKEGLSYLNSADMVADTMMVVQATYMRDIIKNPKRYLENTDDPTGQLENRLKIQSSGFCEAGSAYAIYYLMQKYPDFFKNFALLNSWSTEKHQFKDNSAWHTYFLVLDKQDTWFAGSPANHNPDNPNSPLTNFFKSKNLKEVLMKIKEENGGDWPTEEEIEFAISSRYIPPARIKNNIRGAPQISIFTLDRAYDHTSPFNGDYQIFGKILEPKRAFKEKAA